MSVDACLFFSLRNSCSFYLVKTWNFNCCYERKCSDKFDFLSPAFTFADANMFVTACIALVNTEKKMQLLAKWFLDCVLGFIMAKDRSARKVYLSRYCMD